MRIISYVFEFNFWYSLFIAGVDCDESGTIVRASCNQCSYDLFKYYYEDDYYDFDYYDDYYNDGTYCRGDCSWNSDLDECQMKGILLITILSLKLFIDRALFSNIFDETFALFQNFVCLND